MKGQTSQEKGNSEDKGRKRKKEREKKESKKERKKRKKDSTRKLLGTEKEIFYQVREENGDAKERERRWKEETKRRRHEIYLSRLFPLSSQPLHFFLNIFNTTKFLRLSLLNATQTTTVLAIVHSLGTIQGNGTFGITNTTVTRGSQFQSGHLWLAYLIKI